jgi:hypothetical protein
MANIKFLWVIPSIIPTLTRAAVFHQRIRKKRKKSLKNFQKRQKFQKKLKAKMDLIFQKMQQNKYKFKKKLPMDNRKFFTRVPWIMIQEKEKYTKIIYI